jgi:hypothetical protein
MSPKEAGKMRVLGGRMVYNLAKKFGGKWVYDKNIVGWKCDDGKRFVTKHSIVGENGKAEYSYYLHTGDSSPKKFDLFE